MKLHKRTQNMLNLAEEVSGHPIDVIYNSDLSYSASLRSAGRDGSKQHVISVKEHSPEIDYIVAWQAGFIVRQSRETGEVAFLSRTESIVQEVQSKLKNIRSSMDDEQLVFLSKQLIDGLLTQLRSVPVGLLIDIWIHRDYPDLRSQQKTVLTNQAHEYLASLKIDTNSLPSAIVHSNQLMNAAQAVLIDHFYSTPELIIPYRTAGLESDARALVDLLLSNPIDDIDDINLIDAWADQLGLGKWYHWTKQ